MSPIALDSTHLAVSSKPLFDGPATNPPFDAATTDHRYYRYFSAAPTRPSGQRLGNTALPPKQADLIPLSSLPALSPQLVTFDMDSTLIKEEVVDEIAREAGCYAAVAAITASAMRGEIDFDTSLMHRIGRFSGVHIDRLEGVAQRLTLSPGAVKLCQRLHRLGVRTAILSGGFDFFARVIAQRLGIPQVLCNHLQIRHKRLTGMLEGPIVGAAAKARELQRLVQLWGIDPARTMAVGDGANDLDVMAAATTGVAWHAKPSVATRADIAIEYSGLEVIGLLFEDWRS